MWTPEKRFYIPKFDMRIGTPGAMTGGMGVLSGIDTQIYGTSGPPAGMLMWFDAQKQLFKDAAGTTAATADGDNVGNWPDQSGNSNTAVMHKISTSDAFGTLRLNVVNGLRAVETNFTNLKATVTWRTPWNLFLVMYQVTWRSSAILGGGTGDALRQNGSSPNLRTNDGVVNTDMNSFPVVTWGIIEAFVTGSVVGLKYNGNSDVTNAGGNLLSFSEFHIAVQNDTTGITNCQFAEIIIYSNTTLNSAQRLAARTYLNSKYAIF